jgi:hypothetical protein
LSELLDALEAFLDGPVRDASENLADVLAAYDEAQEEDSN